MTRLTPTAGWLTPSRKLELFSDTMVDFGWAEYATPGYIESHVSHRSIDHGNAEVMLEPDGTSPHTAHTTNPVPFVLTAHGVELRDGGELSDVVPTTTPAIARSASS